MNSDSIIANDNSTVMLKTENAKNTSFRRFNQREWKEVERVYLDKITNTVLEVMRKLGNEKITIHENTSNLKFCGDEVYLAIRNQLVERGYCPNIIIEEPTNEKQNKKKTNAKNNKKSNGKLSREEIIKKNILSTATDNLKETLNTFTDKKYNITYGFNSKYAEIRLITFMYAVSFWIKKNTVNEAHCYELILGIRKTLNMFSQMNGVSKIACDDLKFAYNKLISYCNFKYSTMFEKYPRLCLMTSYDTVFPTISIKPHKSQVELITEIKKRPNGGLYLLKATIGTGKTTVVIAICEIINVIRQLQKASGKKGTTQMIFACSVEPVRHQVCRMAYTQQIPFGIGVTENSNVQVINNYNCESDESRILIVSDLDASIELLNKNQDYILFVDEPTVGADQDNNPITNAVSKIIALAPKTTILCSATLPEPEEIPDIINYWKNKYANTEIISVRSKESLIGCEIINFDGSTVAPHNNCTSCEELQLVVDNLKIKSFIDRLYTAPVVSKLRQKFIDNGINNIFELETYFQNVETLSQANIQLAAISLLEKLIEIGDDNLVKKICTPIGKIEIDETALEIKSEDENENEDNLFSPEVIPDNNSISYNMDEIFTTQAHRYTGGCLITVTDPLKFAFEKSKVLLSKCTSATKIISKYNNSMQKFEMVLQKLETIKDDDTRTQKKQEIESNEKPSIEFPSKLQINTREHLMKYAPHIKNKIDKNKLRYLFTLENIPLTFNVPDYVMLLLYSGVGIYSPKNQLLDDAYNEFVLNMAADGELAFLISDDSICYGANYPFSHVVIEEEIAAKHSIGTIFQLIGRAGRVGQSWVAYAHVGNVTTERIINFIKGNTSVDISDEAKNMNTSFKRVIDEIKTKKERSRQINNDKIIKLSDVSPLTKEQKAKKLQKPENKQSTNQKNTKPPPAIELVPSIKSEVESKEIVPETIIDDWESIVVDPEPVVAPVVETKQIVAPVVETKQVVAPIVENNRIPQSNITDTKHHPTSRSDVNSNWRERSTYVPPFKRTENSQSQTRDAQNNQYRDNRRDTYSNQTRGNRYDQNRDNRRDTESNQYNDSRRNTQYNQNKTTKSSNNKNDGSWTKVGKK